MAKKHKPIKFETTLETSLQKELLKIIRENKKATTAAKAALALIAFGGVLTFGIMAPNALSIFTHLMKRCEKERYEEYRKIWRNFHALKKQRALEFVEEKGGYLIYRPTEKGKEKIKKFILDKMVLEKPKKWDKRWRLVIFDIPETKQKARAALRERLKNLGFYQCQKSVWIHPFPCMEEIEFLKEQLNIKPFVKLFLIDEMEDGKVLYHFKDLIKSSL
ncbi:MAG: CRISPR-associated endonuclease Cas2 [Candidatus Tagabacteria bacterium]